MVEHARKMLGEYKPCIYGIVKLTKTGAHVHLLGVRRDNHEIGNITGYVSTVTGLDYVGTACAIRIPGFGRGYVQDICEAMHEAGLHWIHRQVSL